MNNEVEKVQEDIESAIDTVTIDIPVRVEATCFNDAPFNIQVSIDEVGQIVLTPETKDVEFIRAETDSTVDYDVPIIDQETETIIEDNLTTIKTSIVITAHMLAESDNHDISADVDEIGQVIIYPMAKENSFVTASIANSLNLITEGLEMHEYCDGYRLINPGNSWYVKSPAQEIIGQGFESLSAAKIFVCETEIDRLSRLSEEVEPESESETSNTQEEPEVSAELVENVATDCCCECNSDDEQLMSDLLQITNNYEDCCGSIRCDSIPEAEFCVKILTDKYSTVTVELSDNSIIINYAREQELKEEFDEEERMRVINDFMRGNIPLYSDTGEPQKELMHLSELDTNGYTYYYDPESNAVVSYPSRG